MVSKSDFKRVSCGSYILDIAFITSDRVNNVFRCTMKVLSDNVFSDSTSAYWSNSIGAARSRQNFCVFSASK